MLVTDPENREGRPETIRPVLCRYPYPFRSLFAICSDFDETPDRHVYRDIMRFLNTTEETSCGPGVGLEIGNSIYFWPTFPSVPEFTYWDTDDAGREMSGI